MGDLIRFRPTEPPPPGRNLMAAAGALCVGCDRFGQCKELCSDVRAVLYPAKTGPAQVIPFHSQGEGG